MPNICRDLYTSPKIIKLKELEEEQKEIEDMEKIPAAKKKRLKKIAEEMAPLKKFLDDAASHRAQIKKEIGVYNLISLSYIYTYSLQESLQSDEAKVVLVLDFTKFGQIDEGNVHCFVVTVLSQGTDAKSGILRPKY